MAGSIWHLTGTAEQVALADNTLHRRCDYPWERLLPGLKAKTGHSAIPCEWADLSRWASGSAGAHDHAAGARAHGDDATAHPVEARGRVLGLAYYSGKIVIDHMLDGDLAAEVILAEGAHMADFFHWTDWHRVVVWNAVHGPDEQLPWDTDVEDAVDLGHQHGWFDVGPYGSWVGEAAMEAFVRSFSDVPVTLSLGHTTTPEAAKAVRYAILHDRLPYYGLRRSRVYHDDHVGVPREVEWLRRPDDRRPCRICRP